VITIAHHQLVWHAKLHMQNRTVLA
jgi:hypothetical protein